MRDISRKQMTLRTAYAVAVVYCSDETIHLIKSNQLPKGNLFDVARAAGFIGAKLTPQLLSHCHPVGIDGMDISFEYLSRRAHSTYFSDPNLPSSGILISVNAKSIGRTGIEMESLAAASIVALEIYDMLKPVDQNLEIGNIQLRQKTGGKSGNYAYLGMTTTCAILVCSDSTAAGTRSDKSGLLIKEIMESHKATIIDYKIVPDEKTLIQSQIQKWVAADVHFIFTTGGTGLGPRDHTVAAVAEILERDADGITEAMRAFGQMRTPVAMMSRSVAGAIQQSLIITLPGSSNGVQESLDAILPGVFHARKMMLGGGH
ncbi:bifunctional molybdenum cofactor biosynthesis protein MoaC/MoaB [Sphingobacterium pedocola]|uniref:Bifunctional molybdenum cofactor biosynthesis protein MoaC/MoaB n=1 Tax=Sphingobacterium pedocola TaxID=2082722 RepID=A0ABR9T4S3_9SPHI|nr:bifunctional molybdenum cofactor biosynthesis protein MoaC/MoaB [Sphingobacterium pedocola]MBE8720347.1 bifunctional molybdenum cofactor biosynthesis protein MoaC/MoaB [Sphingobacterium pedocola]